MIKETGVHAKNLIKWAQNKDNVVVLTADLGSSCEVKEFSRVFPSRYYSMGVAEQNMVSWAAGMAREGYYPMLHTFSVFMYRRALDQIEMSVAYSNLPVAFVGFLPGLMTPGGPSHQATNDLAVLRSIPNLRIYETGDATDVETVLEEAYRQKGPVYIRMLRGEIPRLFRDSPVNKYQPCRLLREGEGILIFSSGIMTGRIGQAVEQLAESGLSIRHVHISRIKPLETETILRYIAGIKYGVLTVENHSIIGGLGSAIAEIMSETGPSLPLKRIGIPDAYSRGGSFEYQCGLNNLTADQVVTAAKNLTGSNCREEDFQGTAAATEYFDQKMKQVVIKK